MRYLASTREHQLFVRDGVLVAGDRVFTRDEAVLLLGELSDGVGRVSRFLIESSGAHPFLIELALNGVDLPECEGGYDFVNMPVFDLMQDYRDRWCVSICAEYAHCGDPDMVCERDLLVRVDGGRFVDDGGRFDVGVGDREGCLEVLRDWLYFDGNY